MKFHICRNKAFVANFFHILLELSVFHREFFVSFCLKTKDIETILKIKICKLMILNLGARAARILFLKNEGFCN